MLLAFEKANHQKDWLRRQIMRYGSRGDIIHCQFIITEDGYNNVCLAAWEGYGVGMRTLKSTIQDFEEYEFYDLGSDYYQETYQFFKDNLGVQYSLTEMFLALILGLGKDDPNYMFCSQICALVVQKICHIPIAFEADFNNVTPQQLRDEIVRLGYQPITFKPL
jgi:hypothetical protein